MPIPIPILFQDGQDSTEFSQWHTNNRRELGHQILWSLSFCTQLWESREREIIQSSRSQLRNLTLRVVLANQDQFKRVTRFTFSVYRWTIFDCKNVSEFHLLFLLCYTFFGGDNGKECGAERFMAVPGINLRANITVSRWDSDLVVHHRIIRESKAQYPEVPWTGNSKDEDMRRVVIEESREYKKPRNLFIRWLGEVDLTAAVC